MMADHLPVLLDAQARHQATAGAGARSLRLNAGFLGPLVSRVSVSPSDRDVLPVRAPFTAETVAGLPAGEMGDVVQAVRAARRSQVAWMAQSVTARLRPFRRFHALLLERRDEVLDLIQIETGKTRRDALEEVAETALVTQHYAGRGRRYLRPEPRAGAVPFLTRAREGYRPRGVVALITSWCCPLSTVAGEIVPALMAGNAVVLKPSRQGSLTALWVVDRLVEAGLPAEVVQVVTGRGALLGPALVDRADYVAFAGSALVGRRVARDAADALVGYSLDLAGANALVVLADAEPELAVEGAVRACFASAGQRALGVRRVMVEEHAFEAFVTRFAARTAALRLGSDLDYGSDVGSLASPPQLASVQERVVDAVCRGARIVVGGRARPEFGPLFYEPTILTGVTPDMALLRLETLGPIAAVEPVPDAEEAIRAINQADSGLNVSIWTSNPKRGRAMAARLRAGIASVNDAYLAAVTALDAPIGGIKAAGLGRRHGAVGLRKYTDVQTVAERRHLPLSAPFGISEHAAARIVLGLLRLSGRRPRLR